MAKKSMIERELKRARAVERLGPKRREIKNQLKSLWARMDTASDKEIDVIYAEIEELQGKLDAMPRNSSKIRQMNRCQVTGRPNGVWRKFKLCRIKIREYGMQGLIPGLVKSSW